MAVYGERIGRNYDFGKGSHLNPVWLGCVELNWRRLLQECLCSDSAEPAKTKVSSWTRWVSSTILPYDWQVEPLLQRLALTSAHSVPNELQWTSINNWYVSNSLLKHSNIPQLTLPIWARNIVSQVTGPTPAKDSPQGYSCCSPKSIFHCRIYNTL